MELYQRLPPEALKIVLVLFLSFLIGLEREEHKVAAGSYSFGGVRTFPLIGLIGYSIALISGAQLLPLTVGFLVIAGFLLLSYWHKLSSAGGRRCHLGNVRSHDVPGGSACLLRTFLDCHHAERCQPAVARSQRQLLRSLPFVSLRKRFLRSPSFCF